MNESFDFTNDAQKFFKDKIHALSNAISHEDEPAKISKLKIQLSYAEADWKRYTELHQKIIHSNLESNKLDNDSDSLNQYCKTHFWLL